MINPPRPGPQAWILNLCRVRQQNNLWTFGRPSALRDGVKLTTFINNIIMTDKSEAVGIVVDKVNLIRRISNIEQLPG